LMRSSSEAPPAYRPAAQGFACLAVVLVWASIVWLRQTFDSAHYQTVDAGYYQELASRMDSGRLPVLEGLRNRHGQAFSPYPYGYPALLWLAGRSGQTAVLPSLLVHAACLLLLLCFWSTRYPLWPLVVLIFTDTALELGSSTGAEWVWLMLLTVLGMADEAPCRSGGAWIRGLLAFLAFQIRYATVFLFLLPVSRWLLPAYPAGEKSWCNLRAGFIFGIPVLLQFALEQAVFGQMTGGDRYPNSDTPAALMSMLGTETLNQMLLFRNATGSSALALLAGVFFQVVLLAGFLLWRSPVVPAASGAGYGFIRAGLACLLFHIPLRWYFYFAEGYDCRLLGPGFLLILLGLLCRLAIQYGRPRRIFILLFWLGMPLFSVPWKAVHLRFQEKLWLHTRPVFGFRAGILHTAGFSAIPVEVRPETLSLLL
jgi:hypothetical protein